VADWDVLHSSMFRPSPTNPIKLVRLTTISEK